MNKVSQPCSKSCCKKAEEGKGVILSVDQTCSKSSASKRSGIFIYKNVYKALPVKKCIFYISHMIVRCRKCNLIKNIPWPSNYNISILFSLYLILFKYQVLILTINK